MRVALAIERDSITFQSICKWFCQLFGISNSPM